MSPRASVLVLLAVLAACDEPGPFADVRIYAFDLVGAQTGRPALTSADCAAAQPDPEFYVNCWQTLVLCPSGDAELMLSDVVEGAQYTVDGTTLSVEPGRGAPVRFLLSPDGRTAERVGTGERWARWSLRDERALGLGSACDP